MYKKLIFVLLLLISFLGVRSVHAATIATVTGNEVSFRSGAGTNNPIMVKQGLFVRLMLMFLK